MKPQSNTNNIGKKIDAKQMNGEKEDHKKVAISINVQKDPKTAPLGRMTSVKTILCIWTTSIIPPKQPNDKLLSFFKKQQNMQTDRQKDILTEQPN